MNILESRDTGDVQVDRSIPNRIIVFVPGIATANIHTGKGKVVVSLDHGNTEGVDDVESAGHVVIKYLQDECIRYALKGQVALRALEQLQFCVSQYRVLACKQCGHAEHTTRCKEDAPNAQFTCGCHNLGPSL
jgi:hypothetical protein